MSKRRTPRVALPARPVYPAQADWDRHAVTCEYHEELCGPGEWHCAADCPTKAPPALECGP
ncbi:hypothetical protein Mx9_p39 [Myxococcus phage Mx9]|nr:hypothetical protein Mx9_p39 [Myxococcus phage Mx9]